MSKIRKIVDKNVINRLTTAQELQLPYKELDPIKDKRWNVKKVNAEMLQAIQNGESVDKMKKRLMKVTDMDKVAAKRNARTMHTSFQNLGRLDGMYDMKKEGVDVKKRWLATHIYTGKHKTRKWHSDLDEQVVDLDEPFINYPNGKEKDEIMYPGDPAADPANVYNCRCTLVSEVGGYEKNPETIVNQLSPETREALELYTGGNEMRLTDDEIKEIYDNMVETQKPLYRLETIERTVEEKGLKKGTEFNFSQYIYEPHYKGEGALRSFTKDKISLTKLDIMDGDIVFQTVGKVRHLPIQSISMYDQNESLVFSNNWKVVDIVKQKFGGREWKIYKIKNIK